MAWARKASPDYKVLGRQTLTTQFSTSATHTTYQDEGLSISVSYGPSRILAVSWQAFVYTPGGANSIFAQILRTSTAIVTYRYFAHSLNSGDTTMFLNRFVFSGPATGSTETFKVQIKANTNNTQVSSYADALQPRYLLVEDLGPQ